MRKYFEEMDMEVLLADGFDEAIVGYVERFGMMAVALYDREKCIDILVRRDGMEWDEAEDFFEYNVIGSYAGETTPAFATFFEKP